jgi:hypothetical protein
MTDIGWAQIVQMVATSGASRSTSRLPRRLEAKKGFQSHRRPDQPRPCPRPAFVVAGRDQQGGKPRLRPVQNDAGLSMWCASRSAAVLCGKEVGFRADSGLGSPNRYVPIGLWRVNMACNVECTPCFGLR